MSAVNLQRKRFHSAFDILVPDESKSAATYISSRWSNGKVLQYSFAIVKEDFTVPDTTSHAVVMGIWGRAGGDGIPGLIKELRPRLINLGVHDDHIFSMSWNPDHNDSPFEKPDTTQHVEEIRRREPTPSYVALIGHSYGGWAACRLSRKLSPAPDFVGLIDPVFGPNGDAEKIVSPFGRNIHNWYQRNSITEPTWFEDCWGRVVGCPGGVSCGRHIEGVDNHEVKWRRKWDGHRLKRRCGWSEKPRHAFHLNIDSDRYIWRQIIEQIESDIGDSV